MDKINTPLAEKRKTEKETAKLKQKQTQTQTQTQKITLNNVQVIAESFILLIFAAAVYLFISLISFDPADPSWSQTAWHEPIQNWGGEIGAYSSDIFLQFFGFAAYTIPFLIFLLAGQLAVYFYRDYQRPFNFFSIALRIIGLLAFIFSLTGFLAANINDWEQYQSGGILGILISSEVMPFLGHLGATLSALVLLVMSVTLLTGISWLTILEKIGAVTFLLITPICQIFYVLAKNKAEKKAAKEQQKLQQLQEQQQIFNFDDALNNQDEDANANIAEVFVQVRHDSTQSLADQDVDSDIFSKPSDRLIPEDFDLNNDALDDQLNQTVRQDQDIEQLALDEIPQNQLESEYQIDSDFPPHYSKLPSSHDEEFEQVKQPVINPDYYSPLVNHQDEESHINISLDQEDSLIAPIGAYTQRNNVFATDELTISVNNEKTAPAQVEQVTKSVLTKENIHDSLIHPLLMKSEAPRQRPTTPLPSLQLLTAPPVKQEKVNYDALKAMAILIEKSLDDFKVKARVVDYLIGPVITRFEIELAPGVKASRISTLDRDLARSLSMPSVRVVEVIPGKPYVGLELPNDNRQTVYFREVLDSPQFREAKSPLTIVLGKDISGQSVVADLAKMPHLLVAGTTGSGKSVGVNAMILSVLYKSTPEDVRFIMIDPKMLELSVYEGIPHLLTEVVTDMKDAANALNWCVNEMERRYRLMSALGVRNLAGYNDKIKLAEEMGRPIPDPLWKPGDSMDIEIPKLEKLPYIIVMVDEFADLIMAVGKKVEEHIARLAQKARAAGIHLVLATQRPSVDVITGLIKANIPTRIAFTVSSKIDSRTILDQMGAESLLGMGDMLYLAPNSSIPIRVHGAFVRDEEVHAVAQDWKARGTPKYIENITASSGDDAEGSGFDSVEEDLDPLFDQVVAFVVERQRASISSVQRQFRIGYNRAARIVEQMEMQGIVSTPNHSGNREVLAPASHSDY